MSDNIWSEEWGEQEEDWSGGGGRGKALPRGEELGASVFELDPGNFVVYHFHNRWEELLIVLRGSPTLRTPEGSGGSTRVRSFTSRSARPVPTL